MHTPRTLLLSQIIRLHYVSAINHACGKFTLSKPSWSTTKMSYPFLQQARESLWPFGCLFSSCQRGFRLSIHPWTFSVSKMLIHKPRLASVQSQSLERWQLRPTFRWICSNIHRRDAKISTGYQGREALSNSHQHWDNMKTRWSICSAMAEQGFYGKDHQCHVGRGSMYREMGWLLARI